VKGVAVSADGADAVAPSFETAKSGDYPVVRDLNMYTVGDLSETAQAFLDYGMSQDGQKAVKEVGYIPVGDTGEETGGLSGTLQVNGSTTVTPVAQAWAETFNEEYADAEAIIQGTGSGDGIAALINDQTEIAMASRKMKDKERDQVVDAHGEEPTEWVIGRDGVAFIVHPNNPVEDLTMEELKGIFTGQITNWNEVGGPNQEIAVYTRDSSSGTYGFVQGFVLDDEEYLQGAQKTASNKAIAEAVAQDETGIGYCGLAFLNDDIKGVAVSADGADAVAPNFETAKTGDYPVVRDLNMYTVGELSDLAQTFLDYGMSQDGQKAVKEVGYIPVGDTGEETGSLSGTLQVNGSTTVTPVAQAWAETFNNENPDAEVIIQGTGSGDGIAALINDQTEIAMASRKMKDKEREQVADAHGEEPTEWVIGRDGVAFIVHPNNSVEELTMEELKGIFTGQITNWNEVGGPDQEIGVYTRDSSSGTYGFVQGFVLDDEEYLQGAQKTASNKAIAEAVAQDETGIGYCGLAFLNDDIKGVAVSADGAEAVPPNFETAKTGDYPVVRDLNMYTVGELSDLAQAFLDYGMSADGQAAVKEVGYIPVK
jgi:phosphate transport system substrate-binding protein